MQATTGKTTRLLLTRSQRLRMWAQSADWYQVGALTLLGGLVAVGFMREALASPESAVAVAEAARGPIIVLATAQPPLASLWAAPSPTAPLMLPTALAQAVGAPDMELHIDATAPAGGTSTTSSAGQQGKPGFVLPPGEVHLHQNPDATYYTVGDSQTRYYLDSRGVIAEVRLPGSEPATVAEPAGAPPEQKVFLDPADPDDAAYLNAVPTAVPSQNACSGRCIHRPSR